MTVVLDTCALIWWSLDPEKLSAKAKQSCDEMETQKNGLVSSISIWEIAIKIKNKKLDIGVSLDKYLAILKKSDVVHLIPVDEDIWVKSVTLEWSHRDPADRVVVAMAEGYQSSIVTADRAIKKFYSDTIW